MRNLRTRRLAAGGLAMIALASLAYASVYRQSSADETVNASIKVVKGRAVTDLVPAAAAIGTAPTAPISNIKADPGLTNEPELYTLGSMTWYFSGWAPAAKLDAITGSMDYAVNYFNTLTDIKGNVRAVYGSGTPTADAGYGTQMRFGGQTNRRTALHEMTHYLGIGGIEPYKRLVSGGKFTGHTATQRIQAFNGPDVLLSSNGVHFWPYGMNYDSEFQDSQRTVAMVSAQRADMGLGDGAAAISGNRRFLNRTSRMVLDTGTGSAPLQQPNSASENQIWDITYNDGFITLKNQAGSLSLDGTGAIEDGATLTIRSSRDDEASQQWEMIATDNGWFLLRNRETRKCIDNAGRRVAGAVMKVWTCNWHGNQQWHLVR